MAHILQASYPVWCENAHLCIRLQIVVVVTGMPWSRVIASHGQKSCSLSQGNPTCRLRPCCPILNHWQNGWSTWTCKMVKLLAGLNTPGYPMQVLKGFWIGPLTHPTNEEVEVGEGGREARGLFFLNFSLQGVGFAIVCMWGLTMPHQGFWNNFPCLLYWSFS